MNCSKPAPAPEQPGRSTDARRAWSSAETRSTLPTTEPQRPAFPSIARRARSKNRLARLCHEPLGFGYGPRAVHWVDFSANRTVLGQVGTFAVQHIWKMLATVGQYILPMICLAGAGISAWKRHERRTLVQDVMQSQSANALDEMTWGQFEQLVGDAFRLQGYSVLVTGGGGADGGIDLILTRGGEKFLVQCKQWRAYKVPVGVVRELYGVMAAKGAAGGFVVTSGRFTDDAASFAGGRNVTLIDGPKLYDLLQQAQDARRSDMGPPTSPTVRPRPAPLSNARPTLPALCAPGRW